MQKLIKRNLDFILSRYIQKTDTNTLQDIIENLNKKGLVIISGMKNIGKINILKDFLTRTSTIQKFFYFNNLLDIDNKVKNNKDLEKLLSVYTEIYKTPKIIILHNTNKIDGIKHFISKLYKEKNKDGKSKYKIILLGNNIKIEGIKEIEILSRSTQQILQDESGNIEGILQHGTLEKVMHFVTWEDSSLKENYVELIKNDILLHDIFNAFSVKNIDLYNYTISFLSKNNIFLSLRELQKQLDENKSISLKTTMDYIDFSIQAKIIRKMYKFDLKTNKYISSRAKYFFSDLGIRNSFNQFSTDRESLIENLVFNDLYSLGYEIYGGINGKFDFSFIAEKNNSRLYIHLSKETHKEDIKKEVRKLLKIGDEHKKYLIVDDLENLGLKKFKYDSVEIITLKDFFNTIKT